MKIILEAKILKPCPELANSQDSDFTELLQKANDTQEFEETQTSDNLVKMLNNLEIFCVKLMKNFESSNRRMEQIENFVIQQINDKLNPAFSVPTASTSIGKDQPSNSLKNDSESITLL